MCKLPSKLFSFVFVLALVFGFPQPAFAHSGEPRLEISVERISPGGTVELRGVDFDFEQSVTLSLIGANIEMPLNQVTADTEGLFTQSVLLPADLPVGEYNFRAQTDHEVVMSPLLTVWGTAVEDQESNVIQDQSDVQFEPMPTPIVSVATAVHQVAAPENNVPRQGSSGFLIWIAVGIVIIAFLALALRLKR
jgi:hypothetical protein